MKLKLLYILLVVFVSLVLLFIYNYYIMSGKPIHAIAVFNDTIKGTVKFIELKDIGKIKIELNLSGLKPNSLDFFCDWSAVFVKTRITCTCKPNDDDDSAEWH